MTGEQTPSQYPDAQYPTLTVEAATLLRRIQFAYLTALICGCLPDLGGETYLRECDECGNVWRSAMCRHGSPRCPRCGEITE